MTDERERLEAAIDSAFEAGWNAAVSSAEPEAFLPGAEEEARLHAMKAKARAILDAMPEGPSADSGWIDAGAHQAIADLDTDTGWVVADEGIEVPKRAKYRIWLKPEEDAE